MKGNAFIKMAVISLVAILGLWVLQGVLFSPGVNVGYNIRGHMGGGYMYMGTGFAYGGTISYLLLLMVKVLFVVFTISLVAGIILWIKNNLFTREEIETIKGTFTGNKQIANIQDSVIQSHEVSVE
ncbi:hypothetical protein [Geosporobacter ferrireducens]|uniref:Uncharacterized protein n=1 Tax=Geosporobacter ferrireducens TaxID=1424294 RepID=A0A1D8GE23_9FIRM|nr:hypothetical protein [Geosporobacter ferrireducens]AOT69147.1 hypothetical protein Gferi_05975 [Geosporobacter ferrireducens]MTI56825.1 hypothetical protein [Geosporobacter ferrireducens]